MPYCCCAVGCTNRQGGIKKNLSFYNMPRRRSPFEQRRREEWIRAIRRDDWKDWSYDRISKQTICGEHFISGKRSEDPNDPDWVPSVFSYNGPEHAAKQRKKIQRAKRFAEIQAKRLQHMARESNQETQEDSLIIPDGEVGVSFGVSSADASHTGFEFPPVDPVQEELATLRQKLANLDSELRERNSELYKLRQEIEDLKSKPNPFSFKTIKDSDKDINFFTGMPSVCVFYWVVNRVKGRVKKCRNSLSVEDHVLMVLMKLRLGLLNRDIAYRFGLNPAMVSKIYRKWLPVISTRMKKLIVWPERACIRRNLPQSFQKKFRDSVCIIDCSEIFIQRPKNLTARAQTWSNYKHNNTIKYLVGISPAGAVMFMSAGWGGRVSDKQITMDSGFLDKVSPGDCVLADRGFLIKDELNERGATLKIPSFTKGKKQLPAREVDESRSLSRVRIHVERVIGRLKTYRILNSIVPVSQVDLLDDAMVVISACINLNRSVVTRKILK